MLFGEGPQIKNIAADLNKLFRQGSLLNQIGQTIEGDSTADQGTSDLLAARDPVIQEISVGMSGEQSARYTVSGTPPLSLPNSLGKPLKAWEVALSPYQEGSGDPSPDNVRPIYGTDKVTITTAGVNLIDQDDSTYLNTLTSVYGNSDSNIVTQLNALPAGTYTLSLKAKVTDYLGAPAVQTNVGLYIRAINNGTQLDVVGTINTTPTIGEVLSTSKTFTLTSEYVGKVQYCYAYTGKNNTVQPEVVYEGIIYDVQIENGSTATPYTPYLAPSQTVLTLPQTVYTGTIGSEGGESRWGEVDLGTLMWAKMTISGHYHFRALVSDGKYGAWGGFNALCDCYSRTGNPTGTVDNTFTFGSTYHHGSYCYVSIYDADFEDSTADDFKTAMSGHMLVYPLHTPTTFAVPSVTIPTPSGTATTWATAEDGTVDSMEVTYVGKA